MAGNNLDLALDVDNYKKQKILTKKESIVQFILNLLNFKEGDIPNLPHLGINIRQYLYAVEGTVDATYIKNKIVSQCEYLQPYLLSSNVVAEFVEYNNSTALLLVFPLIIEGEDNMLYMAISRSTDKEEALLYNAIYDK